MDRGVNSCQCAVAMKEVLEDVIEIARFLSVCLDAVNCFQPSIGVYADSVGAISNDISYLGSEPQFLSGSKELSNSPYF